MRTHSLPIVLSLALVTFFFAKNADGQNSATATAGASASVHRDVSTAQVSNKRTDYGKYRKFVEDLLRDAKKNSKGFFRYVDVETFIDRATQGMPFSNADRAIMVETIKKAFRGSDMSAKDFAKAQILGFVEDQGDVAVVLHARSVLRPDLVEMYLHEDKNGMIRIVDLGGAQMGGRASELIHQAPEMLIMALSTDPKLSKRITSDTAAWSNYIAAKQRDPISREIQAIGQQDPKTVYEYYRTLSDDLQKEQRVRLAVMRELNHVDPVHYEEMLNSYVLDYPRDLSALGDLYTFYSNSDSAITTHARIGMLTIIDRMEAITGHHESFDLMRGGVYAATGDYGEADRVLNTADRNANTSVMLDLVGFHLAVMRGERQNSILLLKKLQDQEAINGIDEWLGHTPQFREFVESKEFETFRADNPKAYSVVNRLSQRVQQVDSMLIATTAPAPAPAPEQTVDTMRVSNSSKMIAPAPAPAPPDTVSGTVHKMKVVGGTK